MLEAAEAASQRMTTHQEADDQVAALKWVRENIKAFSGDPGRITIMGQQAGGASVHYHMLSPLSRGLFARSDH